MEDMKKPSVREGVARIVNQERSATRLSVNLPITSGIKNILNAEYKLWAVAIYSRHIHLSLVNGTAMRRAWSGKYKGEK
jgi:hypothetical protein